MGQWRDQMFAAAHPEAAATVVSVTTSGSGRGTAPVTETLAFTPTDGAALCRIPINMGSRPRDMVGQTITVVPRSAGLRGPCRSRNDRRSLG